MENIIIKEREALSMRYSVFLFQMGIWNTIFSKGQEGGTGNGNL